MNLKDLINDPDMLVLDTLAERCQVKHTKRDVIKPIVEYTAEGVYIADYESIKKAHQSTSVPENSIRNICTGHMLRASDRYDNRIFLYRGGDIIKRLEEIEANKDNYKFLYPKAHGKEVWEYTLGGRLLYKHPMSTIAAKLNNVTPNLITSCCKGKRLFIDKRIFLYPGDNIKERVKLVKQELYKLSNKRPKYKPVDVYTLDGEFIGAYPSASAAGRDLDVHVSDITRCCNGVNGHGSNSFTSKGKIFLWVGESISERLEQIKQLKEQRDYA